MDTIRTYLNCLQGRIFKLLPLREKMDSGENSFLAEYIDNLMTDISGAESLYPYLAQSNQFMIARNNICCLKENVDLDFQSWRNIVLRSTRLIGDARDNLREKLDGTDCVVKQIGGDAIE